MVKQAAKCPQVQHAAKGSCNHNLGKIGKMQVVLMTASRVTGSLETER